VNAGHGATILVRADGNRIQRLTDGGPILGCLLDARYSAGEIQISHDDTLVLYTDGVSEAPNKKGEEFGDERLVGILSDGHNSRAASLCERIGHEVNEFSGPQATLHDDRTLLVVRFLFTQTRANGREFEPAIAQVA
jgi:sigma-B regulation protein RsbU (phosphoserine phosphatase)